MGSEMCIRDRDINGAYGTLEVNVPLMYISLSGHLKDINGAYGTLEVNVPLMSISLSGHLRDINGAYGTLEVSGMFPSF